MTKYLIKTTYIQKCTQKHSADHYHKIVTTFQCFTTSLKIKGEEPRSA